MLPSVSLILAIILLRNNLIEACSSCSQHQWKTFLPRTTVLNYLSNFRKLNSLSLIATHSSFSYLIKEPLLQTQDFDVDRQMMYGVRGLDVGVCSRLGTFEIYVGGTPVNITFDDVLNMVDRFLDRYTGELMMILIRQAHVSVNHSKDHCRVLNRYLTQQNGRRLVTKWQLNDTVGLHRGKILVASLDSAFRDCAFMIRDNCLVGEDKDVDIEAATEIGAVAKWRSMFEFSKTMVQRTSECYFNNVGFGYDGDVDRRTMVRDAGYRHHDNSCAKPINLDAMELFKKPDEGFVMMMIEFPVQELIDKVNDGNYGDSSWRSGW